jgi:microcystin-dependent protein
MQPYVGEIITFGGSFAPAGWQICAGQVLPISENDTLFNLIGTTYGGDGQETFNLPDLQGRLPVHMNGNYQIGQVGGSEYVTINQQQVPSHNHAVNISTSVGSASVPSNQTYLATPYTAAGPNATALKIFSTDAPDSALSPQTIGVAGGSQPMSIMQPYLAVTYCISLFGVYPSQT